jgi:hypothetical protein
VIASNDVRWIQLEVTEVFDRLEDRGRARTRRAVEELRMDGEAARLSQRDLYATGTCGCFSGARSRKFTMSSSDSGES